MSNVTMEKIAKEAGISKPTVSRILNNKYFVGNKETKEKVWEIAKRLDYHPNYMAQALSTGKRFCIGIAGTGSLEQMDDISVSRMYSGIGGVAEQHKYNLTFFPLGTRDLYEMLLQVIKRKMVDGLIIMVYLDQWSGFNKRIADILIKEQVPFVAIHVTTTRFDCNNVGYNAAKAGFLATRHLADQGYRDISLITEGHKVFSDEFYQGYADVMRQTGGKEQRVDITDQSMCSAINGYETGRQIIREQGIADGYVITHDAFAYGFIRALREAGRRVPEDVGIVGGNNQIKDIYFCPFLTTLDQKFEERGQKAAEMLFADIEKKEAGGSAHQSYVAQPELVVRESSRKKS